MQMKIQIDKFKLAYIRESSSPNKKKKRKCKQNQRKKIPFKIMQML